jgi:hypothetical protein
MTTDLAIFDAPTVNTETDGWHDVSSDTSGRTIQGAILKCVNGEWLRGKEAAKMNGARLAAMAVRDAWVQWKEQRPTQYVWREVGKPLPERDELGDLDESQWEEGIDGKPKDSWACTRFLYLWDPKTGERFTYSTSSYGGRSAVGDLADQITSKRFAHPTAVPIVELANAPMVTKYGRRIRPHLLVVSWLNVHEEEKRQALLRAYGGTSAEAALDDEIAL